MNKTCKKKKTAIKMTQAQERCKKINFIYIFSIPKCSYFSRELLALFLWYNTLKKKLKTKEETPLNLFHLLLSVCESSQGKTIP